MEFNSETIPSPPSIVQSETYIISEDLIAPVDLVAPTDLVCPSNTTKEIIVGHKRPTWARQNLKEAEGNKSPQGTTRESKRPKRFSNYLSTMTHIIDPEPSCLQVNKDGKIS
jgi:hypothetical protein